MNPPGTPYPNVEIMMADMDSSLKRGGGNRMNITGMNLTIVRTLNNRIKALADRIQNLEDCATTVKHEDEQVASSTATENTKKSKKRWEQQQPLIEESEEYNYHHHLQAIEQQLSKGARGYNGMSPKSKRSCLQGVQETIGRLQKLESEMRAADAKQEERGRMHDLADSFLAYIHSIPPPGREPYITLSFVASQITPWIHRLPLTYFEATVRFLQGNTGASCWTREEARAFIANVTAALEKDRGEIDLDFI